MGKHSNLVLVDRQSGQIIDAIKRYSHAVSRHREVLPGRIYIPPPDQSKASPLSLDEEQFVKVLQSGGWDLPLGDLVFRKLAGIGPELARELVGRADLAPDLLLEDCGEYELRRLWQALQQTVGPLLQGKYEPTLYTPFRPIQVPGRALDAAASLNQAADDFYAGHTEMARFRQLQSALVNAVSQEAARVSKKLWLQEQSQTDAQKIQDYRIRGEMLLANLHLIKRDRQWHTCPTSTIRRRRSWRSS